MSKKKSRQRRRASDKIRFSIGAKLITIISIIVIMSLGSITALVSWLVRGDLQLAAEDDNFEANRRLAMEAETTIANARSNARMLLQTIALAGPGSALARAAAGNFFEENPQTAALFYATFAETEDILTNGGFFSSRDIDPALAESYRFLQRAAIRRAAAGETVVLNATPHFTVPMLAMFFPWKDGGGGVLFAPASLNDTFGFGTSQSYLINDADDVLAHGDFQMVRSGASVSDEPFTRYLRESASRNSQTLYSGSDGRRYFAAFTKLGMAGAVVVTRIEYDKVFEQIVATTRRNLLLTGAVLSISVILIWFFSKTISTPLKALAAAARNIEGGIFEVDLHSKSRDEIGLLTASFQKMAAALNIFGRFTNRDIAIKAMRGQIKPGGLPKHATIFFSDIRGFTEKSEGFTNVFGDGASDRIIFWLNAYFTKMVECVEKTSGTVDKFIGDAVMAHWGTAQSSGSPQKDAFNCVLAALMMRKSLLMMNKARRANDPSDPPIRIGCGINTGIVTAGQLGSDQRMEYTAIGDPVNLASRVEALTKPLGADILITEDTWNMVKNQFIVEEMPPVTVKGKEKPVRIFAVVNFKGIGKGPQSMADVRSLLGIDPPDIGKVDVNADEKKYKIGDQGKQKKG